MKKFHLLIICLFVCSFFFAQNSGNTKVHFIKNQNYLSENSGKYNFSGSDSLQGFDETALKAQLLAKGVYGSEYIGYCNLLKRDFINKKYKLKTSQPILEDLNAKVSSGPNFINTAGCVNEGFESTAPGTYTAANAVAGWSLSSRTTYSCTSSPTWAPGSSEFSVISTPILNFPVIGNIPNSPLGGSHVVQLNDFSTNQHVTRLSQTITVTSLNTSFKFAYAGVWQDAGHHCCEQPQFNIELQDCSGSALYCSSYSVTPGSTLCSPNMAASTTISPGFFWTNWQVKTVDLTPFIGSCVVVNVISSDCVFSGHYGTVLFDALCSSGIPVMNNSGNNQTGWVNYCAGSGQALLNAPAGYSSYQWYAPGGSMIAAPQGTAPSLTVLNPSVIPLSVYTVDLTSYSGCVFIGSYTMAYTQVTISAIESSSTCITGASGGATVNAAGSGTGYNYTWLNATNSVVSTSSVLANMPGGIYTVSLTAIGAAGCGSAVSTVTIGAGPPEVNTLLKPYCNNAYFVTPGGSNFQWYNNLTPISAPTGTAAAYTNTAPCNGCITWLSYTDLQGCRDSVQYIMVAASPGTLNVTASSSVCPGPGQGTAVIDITPVSNSPAGTNSFSVYSIGSFLPPYSTSLSPTSATSFTAQNLPGGATYSVNVFDGSCSYTSSFAVNYLTPPFDFTLSASSTTICNGNTSNASINFTSPAVSSLYTYSWLPNFYVTPSPTLQHVIISPTLTAGSSTTIIYSAIVTPTDANCPLTKTISITAVNILSPVLSPISALCSNSGSVGISANPGGGIFNSTNSAVNSSGAISPSLALTGLNTFTYSIVQSNCVASSTGTFLVNAAPVLNGLNSSTICIGETVILSVSGAGNFTWNTGTTGSVITVNPLSNTVYSVISTDPLTLCSNSKEVTITVSGCTKINEWHSEKNINVYPNPTTGSFIIETADAATITVCDALGRIILKKDLESGSNSLNLDTYPNGIYLLKLHYNKEEVRIIKLVKNN